MGWRLPGGGGRSPIGALIYLLSLIALLALGYQITALVAAIRHLVLGSTPVRNQKPVSILKPVRGLDPDFLEAIRSYATQDYGAEFELLFGATDPTDPCLPVVEQLQKEFPQLPIRILISRTQTPNAKVGTLIDLAHQARHSLLLVSDSDILVPPGYLKKVTAPLEDENVGVVTTLYRARAATTPGLWEALGIAIDFAPSVLVAPLVGIREFGLGATLVFRRQDLLAIGGFEAIGDYLADDYQLTKAITGLGKSAFMSDVVVETSIDVNSWRGVWRHQVRWARTIRASRGDGYLGLPVTHAGVWALLALALGFWKIALLLVVARWLSALATGVLVLKSPVAQAAFWLAPVWDLWAFAVWAAGLTGSTIVWRDGVLKLTKEGKLLR